jgi:CDP-diacylglycerol--glycerol-3-phosphate 3-phosphatidyltransferase
VTLANRITLFRIALIVPFVWTALVSMPFGGHPHSGVLRYTAMGILILAALTDIVDGHLARKMNQITSFGKFIDPLADKLLIMAALFCFVYEGRVGAAPAILILTREFAVTALRSVAVERGTVIAAGVLGKIKLIVQVVVLSYLFTPLSEPPLPWWDGVSLGTIAVWLMTAVTVWSGADYLIRHRSVVSTK